jgi:hypothetical protein
MELEYLFINIIGYIYIYIYHVSTQDLIVSINVASASITSVVRIPSSPSMVYGEKRWKSV